MFYIGLSPYLKIIIPLLVVVIVVLIAALTTEW